MSRRSDAKLGFGTGSTSRDLYKSLWASTMLPKYPRLIVQIPNQLQVCFKCLLVLVLAIEIVLGQFKISNQLQDALQ
jgi:hypothetical protein